MKPAEIQAALKTKGFYMSDVARALAISTATVSNVVHGKTKSRRTAKAIAKLTGYSVNELWPGQYPERYRRATMDTRMAQVMAMLAEPEPKPQAAM